MKQFFKRLNIWFQCLYTIPKIEIETEYYTMSVNEEKWISIKPKGIFLLKINGNSIEDKGGILLKVSQAGNFLLEIKGIGLYGKAIKKIKINAIEAEINSFENTKVELLNITSNDFNVKENQLNLKNNTILKKQILLHPKNSQIKHHVKPIKIENKIIKITQKKHKLKTKNTALNANISNRISDLKTELENNYNIK